MAIGTVLRVAVDYISGNTLREIYWDVARHRGMKRRLHLPENSALKDYVREDFRRFWHNTVEPVEGELEERLEAAVQWILRAQDATSDRGVSLGYFPLDGSGWRPSYPETTGYIITTLLDYAARKSDAKLRDRALEMARWEIEIQMRSGAVQGGPLCPPANQTPVAFNTGIVLDGWCTAYEHSHDGAFLEAGRRAAEFLVGDIDAQGYFRTNGSFVSPGGIKNYNSLCAWPMYRLGQLTEEERYREAAVRVVEAALRLQRPNGWFANNCLSCSEAPLTHTLGYTMQGVLEVGLLANREDFVEAASRSARHLVAQRKGNGFLAGRFDQSWRPRSLSSCLTGSAQVGVVCYRLGQALGDVGFREAADTLINFLKALQPIESRDASMAGAIAGSFPFLGAYMKGGFPNWATKYFIDALLLQQQARGACPLGNNAG